jgi:toxin-antitoxin system PIN domain toxin
VKLLDVNVVLAAHRDDHPQFPAARPWLEGLLDDGEPFAVPDLVAGSFLRIATNRRIFVRPTPVAEAFEYLAALRGQPRHLLLGPGRRHLELLRELCDAYDAAGDLVPDAQLAAIALEHGGEVVSFDRDFARFERVRWTRPG